jgi:hypothetical protein
MFAHETGTYHGYLIRPVVTRSGDGRYQAAAIIEDRAGATHTLALDAAFYQQRDAADAARESAIAWLQRLASTGDRVPLRQH